jgi:plasmid maintenance system antidote protein VapI
MKLVCTQSKIKANNLAEDIGVTTDAVYKMFNCESIKIDTVLKVSKSLQHDFFKPYLEQLQPNIYLRLSELEKENQQLKSELQTLRIEAAVYKKLLKISEPEK